MHYSWNDGTSLYHYGILGQKWGVRRYQNPDGTLTEEGKKRYGGLGVEKGVLRNVDLRAMRRASGRIVYFGKDAPGKNQQEVLNKYRKEANNSKYEKELNKMDKKGRELLEEGKKIQSLNDEKLTAEFMDKYYKFRQDYYNLQVKNSAESKKIAEKYVSEMNQALVKDLGFEDIKTGSDYLTNNRLGWDSIYIYNKAWFNHS